MTALVSPGLDRAGRARPASRPLADTAATAGGGAVGLRGIGKTYRSSAGLVRALDGIDLDIAPGEIFGIIGRSGAGKSSLLRMINRLEQPSEGQVLIDGADIAGLNSADLVALRRRIGMIFQHFNLLSAKTVQENVALPLNVAGLSAAEIAPRVDEALALVGLTGKEKTYPSRLSGGQKQRVGIARALVSRPEILLCDEATSALDPETTLSILRLLRDINRRLGLTIVLITHEMAVIREICHRVLVLDHGRIAEQGPVWQVFGAPRHPATQALLGPVQQSLPEDLQARLTPSPRNPRDHLLLRLIFAGRALPDLSAFAPGSHAGQGPDLGQGQDLGQSLGPRLLAAGLDRIQGHGVGQLLIALPQGPDHSQILRALAAQADHHEVLGYADPTDD